MGAFVDLSWMLSPPRRDPPNLSLSDEEIREQTERAIVDEAAFAPCEAWLAEFLRRLEAGSR